MKYWDSDFLDQLFIAESIQIKIDFADISILVKTIEKISSVYLYSENEGSKAYKVL